MPTFLNGKINMWSFHLLEDKGSTEDSRAERRVIGSRDCGNPGSSFSGSVPWGFLL